MTRSHLDAGEVSRARSGPRELKNPRSRDYAIQTVHALKRNLESQRIDTARVVEELAEIDRYRHWEVLGYSSREELLVAEVDAGYEAIKARVQAAVAAAKVDPIREGHDLKQARAEGGKRGGRGNLASHRRKVYGETSTYLARRMQREAATVFAALERGEYKSVRAAARAAGIIKIKTPLQQLEHWWAKTPPEDQLTFLRSVRVQ